MLLVDKPKHLYFCGLCLAQDGTAVVFTIEAKSTGIKNNYSSIFSDYTLSSNLNKTNGKKTMYFGFFCLENRIWRIVGIFVCSDCFHAYLIFQFNDKVFHVDSGKIQ